MPLGVLDVPGEISATVAVQVETSPRLPDSGEQATLVDVSRLAMFTVALPVLAECVESPLYVAETLRVPDDVGVMFTEQEPLTSVHDPLGANVTEPVGVLAVPGEVSVIVAEHDRATPTVPEAGHVTVVAELRSVTVTIFDTAADWLLESVAVRVTLKDPKDAYVCVTALPEVELPSPKFQVKA